MRDLNDLFYFAAVVDHHGFAPAARALDVPKSTLSRRVARLEDRLGVRLIERSTRRFSVTEVGQEFYQHCKAMITEAETAEEVAARVKGEPRGVVKCSVPLALALGPVAEVLPRFLALHPKVQIQLVVTNRRIDLIEEGIDVALRVRPTLDTDQDLKVRILGHERGLLVASPAFLKAHGDLEHPSDLERLPTLSHTERRSPDTWKLSHADGREYVVHHHPRLSGSDFKVLLRAAIHGAGVAFLTEPICAYYVGTGELVHVLPDWTAGQGIAHLVFTTRRGQLPAVSAFIDFLAEALPPLLKAQCPTVKSVG